MNASMRDIKGRIDSVEVPLLDVAGIVDSGERRLRRRRASAVVGAAAAVLAVGIGATTWTSQSTDTRGPVEQPTLVPTIDRPLTFAVGSTIHYGGQTIEVEQEVHMIDVTDDGVVFVRQEPGTHRYEQPRAKQLWFTDGSEIVQIGTVFGSPARGYGVTTADAGSTLVWRDPTVPSPDTQTVVFDTASMQVLTRLPDVLSVYPGIVYWVDTDPDCWSESGPVAGSYFSDPLSGEGVVLCSSQQVMRYDAATGSSEPLTRGVLEADASRPRTITSPNGDGVAVVRSLTELDFDREGTVLTISNRVGERTPEFTYAHTGEPMRLRLSASDTTATYFQASHWLDDDTFVLFGYTERHTELADEGDILTCTLSTGTCRALLRGERGTTYQLPRLD